jgi:hypothetical protein
VREAGPAAATPLPLPRAVLCATTGRCHPGRGVLAGQALVRPRRLLQGRGGRRPIRGARHSAARQSNRHRQLPLLSATGAGASRASLDRQWLPQLRLDLAPKRLIARCPGRGVYGPRRTRPSGESGGRTLGDATFNLQEKSPRTGEISSNLLDRRAEGSRGEQVEQFRAGLRRVSHVWYADALRLLAKWRVEPRAACG